MQSTTQTARIVEGDLSRYVSAVRLPRLRRLSSGEIERFFPPPNTDYDALLDDVQPGEVYAVTNVAYRHRTSLHTVLRKAARRRDLVLTFSKHPAVGEVAFKVGRVEGLP
jgi:hypothetical protein